MPNATRAPEGPLLAAAGLTLAAAGLPLAVVAFSTMRSRLIFTFPIAAGLLAAVCLTTPLPAQTLPGTKAQQPARPKAVPPPAPSAAELKAPPANASKLPSGIATLQLRPGGSGAAARPQDIVFFRAILRRRDGTVVQNGFDSADPSKSFLGKLKPSWQVALASMRAGEQRRFWFPAELMPKDPTTGVQEPIVFDVELIRVGSMPDKPSLAPPANARKIGGTSVVTVSTGTGPAKAVRTDGAMVEYTLWKGNGEVVSSSVVDGRPTLFPLDRVMPAFADCVVGMALGERRRCWIPSAHNQGFPGALQGDLVFELELKQVLDMAKLTGNATPPAKS